MSLSCFGNIAAFGSIRYRVNPGADNSNSVCVIAACMNEIDL